MSSGPSSPPTALASLAQVSSTADPRLTAPAIPPVSPSGIAAANLAPVMAGTQPAGPTLTEIGGHPPTTAVPSAVSVPAPRTSQVAALRRVFFTTTRTLVQVQPAVLAPRPPCRPKPPSRSAAALGPGLPGRSLLAEHDNWRNCAAPLLPRSCAPLCNCHCAQGTVIGHPSPASPSRSAAAPLPGLPGSSLMAAPSPHPGHPASHSHKKEYVEWLTGAKHEDTRQKRLQTALLWIAEGKSQSWKYSNGAACGMARS